MKTFSQRLVYAWRHLHWRNLRKFARSKVVQSAAVFPFIGYFALINQKTASLLKPPDTLAALFLLIPNLSNCDSWTIPKSVLL
jgi:hypothetical protein